MAGERSSSRKPLDLALRVLDQQLVDWEGRRCGRVDDVVLRVRPDGSLEVAALLTGRRAMRRRLPKPLRFLAGLGGAFGDAPLVTVPWDEVEDITHVVKLKRTAGALGLAKGEEKAARLVRRVPGA
jgi:hypothetical protein